MRCDPDVRAFERRCEKASRMLRLIRSSHGTRTQPPPLTIAGRWCPDEFKGVLPDSEPRNIEFQPISESGLWVLCRDRRRVSEHSPVICLNRGRNGCQQGNLAGGWVLFACNGWPSVRLLLRIAGPKRWLTSAKPNFEGERGQSHLPQRA